MKSLSVKLGVVLIGLAIFTNTEVCSAENWVLWNHWGYTKGKNAGIEQWSIIEAFPSYDLCMKEWNKKVGITAKSVNATQMGKGEFSIRFDDDALGFVEYKCLPDSIDPRK